MMMILAKLMAMTAGVQAARPLRGVADSNCLIQFAAEDVAWKASSAPKEPSCTTTSLAAVTSLAGTNVAAQSEGGVPFGSSSLASDPSACTSSLGGEGLHLFDTGKHCWRNINDGARGNDFSWIPNGIGFAGVRFPSLKVISGIRVSRDVEGAHTDRINGWYAVKTSASETATYDTPGSSWCSAGGFNRSSPGLLYFQFAQPINARAIRIDVEEHACIDELEVYGEEATSTTETVTVTATTTTASATIVTATATTVTRVDESSVVGDPHVVNAAHAKFDIRAEGLHKLVQIPQLIQANRMPDLRVDAKIQHLVSNDCSKSFMTSLSIFGRWTEDAAGLMRISQGSDMPNTTLLINTLPPEQFFTQFPLPGVKVGGASIVFKLKDVSFHVGKHFEGRYGKQQAYLNVRITGLKAHNDLGGLLGYDDHADAEKLDVNCMAAEPAAAYQSSFVRNERPAPIITDGGSRIEAE